MAEEQVPLKPKEYFGPGILKSKEELTNATPLEFFAYVLCQQSAREKGYAAAPRWGALRNGVKKKFLAKAQEAFHDWMKEELEALESRFNSL